MTPPRHPATLPETLTVRDALTQAALDRALALVNAVLAAELQACVGALMTQRAAS